MEDCVPAYTLLNAGRECNLDEVGQPFQADSDLPVDYVTGGQPTDTRSRYLPHWP